MGLLHVARAVALVGPDHGARPRLEGVEEDAHEGPDAGAEVDDAVHDHGRAAGGPGRDEPLVPEDAAVAGAAAELPQDVALSGIQAVQVTVVARHVDAAVPGGRSVADRPVGEEGPFLLARAGVVRRHPVLPGRGDDHHPSQDDGLVDGIHLHAGLIGPSRLQRRQFPRPLELEALGQGPRRAARVGGVAAPEGPVGVAGGLRRRSRSRREQEQGEGEESGHDHYMLALPIHVIGMVTNKTVRSATWGLPGPGGR